MKKLFLIAAIALLGSCSRSHDTIVVHNDKNYSTQISKEQALKHLYSELQIIDGKTRAEGNSRTVKSIRNLTGATTRSGNVLSDDLLYIVEFEEGQGSAIVAADYRLEPVIAVLDSSVIKEEDFSSNNTDNINSYVASLISDYTIAVTSSEGPLPLTPAPDMDNADTTFLYDIHPKLKTKWHQGSPFNDKCVEVYGSDAVAGCAPIALAQFMYYQFPNSMFVFDNYTILMSNLRALEFTTNLQKPVVSVFTKTTAANLLYSIGIEIDADYNSYSTGASINNTVDFVREFLNYNNAASISYDTNTVYTKLNDNKVIITTGYTSNNSGHAWIIDGGYHYIVSGTQYLHDGTAIEITNRLCKKVHCNYGWGGVCDGYYTEYLFDTTTPNYEIEFSNGDIIGTGTSNYDTNIKIINY